MKKSKTFDKLELKQETQGRCGICFYYPSDLAGLVRSLANFLEKDGFDFINLTYPSTSYKIEELTNLINSEISKRVTENKPIHFIGYSMGGLMVRALIHKYNYQNLGKVIQLAAPNHGSAVADFVKNFWPYKKIFGPAGQQLVTDQTAIKHLFGEVNIDRKHQTKRNERPRSSKRITQFLSLK